VNPRVESDVTPHVIVWDLDLTLGRFDGLVRRQDGAEPVPVAVRPHLAEALAALGTAGFRHALLTLATPLYADLALRGTGLRDHFTLVEGLGQRGKGDAVGVGAALGVAEADLPHRLLFVGDHPVNDEPRDPRVLFHLEVFAMSRSAKDLAALALALRDLGGGSLREGFEELGRRAPWWRRLWRFGPSLPTDRPVRRSLPGLPPLLLMHRREDCPVIAFARPPDPAVPATETSFVPAAVVSPLRTEP
jgi:hypothetical protein